MTIKIIDSHAHLHDEKFSDDLDQVLLRAKQAGITRMITIGCDIPTTTRAHSLAQKYDQIYFTAGFHPHDAKLLTDQNFSELRNLATNNKCVAIGECGLDYYYNHSDHEQQQEAFIKQISLAQELKLPLIIHLRDAHQDCINILKSKITPDQKIVIHCFSGTLTEAHEFHELGCYISISGIITFKKPGFLPQIVQEIPKDKLLVETDCPYLAPHPHRGARNEPSYITHTLQIIAQSRGENLLSTSEQIYNNTLKFFFE